MSWLKYRDCLKINLNEMVFSRESSNFRQQFPNQNQKWFTKRSFLSKMKRKQLQRKNRKKIKYYCSSHYLCLYFAILRFKVTVVTILENLRRVSIFPYIKITAEHLNHVFYCWKLKEMYWIWEQIKERKMEKATRSSISFYAF